MSEKVEKKVDTKIEKKTQTKPKMTKKERRLFVMRKLGLLNTKSGAKYTRAALRIREANREVMNDVV